MHIFLGTKPLGAAPGPFKIPNPGDRQVKLIAKAQGHKPAEISTQLRDGQQLTINPLPLPTKKKETKVHGDLEW